MDIKKSKISGNREWSPSTQKKLASMLGVSAVTIIAACSGGDPVVSGGDIEDADSSSSEVVTDGMGPIDDGGQDFSSSSEKAPNSSDSDPVAGISSSSMAPQPFSSNSEDPPITSGILPPSSSSYEIDTLEVTSGEVIPPEIVGPESGSNIDIDHLESSSSIAEPSSSSFQQIRFSSTTSGMPLSSGEVIPPSSSSTEQLPGDSLEVPPPPPQAGVIENQTDKE